MRFRRIRSSPYFKNWSSRSKELRKFKIKIEFRKKKWSNFRYKLKLKVSRSKLFKRRILSSNSKLNQFKMGTKNLKNRRKKLHRKQARSKEVNKQANKEASKRVSKGALKNWIKRSRRMKLSRM